MAVEQQKLNYFLQLLRELYSDTASYDSRAYAIKCIEELENATDGPTKVAIGLHILSLETERLAVRAYGPVLVQRCISQHLIRAEDVPVHDLYKWYSSEVTSRILRKSMIDLTVEVIVNSSPEVLVKLLDIVFSFFSEIYEELRIEKQMDTIASIIRAIFDPCVRHARLSTLRLLQSAIQAQLDTVLGLALHFLGWLHSKERDNAPLSVEEKGILVSATEILGYLSPLATESQWESLSIEKAMRSLLMWFPARRTLIHTYKTVILSLSGDNLSKGMASIEVSLFKTVTELCKLCTSAGEEEVNFIEGVLQLMEEMKHNNLKQHTEDVITAALSILQVPSLYFASRVCSILRLIDENVLAQVPFFQFCDAMFLFAQKNLFHPVNGSHEVGKVLSYEQFSSADMYSFCFGDFRSVSKVLLAKISLLQPQLCNSYILHRIMALPSSEGTAEDPRTNSGFVTQQSRTFVLWEATSWVIMHLCGSFEVCEDNVAAAFSGIMSKNSSDAVLRPCFLDIMVCFWKPKIAEKCVEGLWEKTIQVLISDLKNTSASSLDIDVQSARRRVALLLGRASTLSQYFSSLLSTIISHLQAELVRATGKEQSILYEAYSSFSVAQAKCLGSENVSLASADPLIQEGHRLVFSVASTQEAFDTLLTTGTNKSLQTIRNLTEAFSTIASHFKTSDCSAFRMSMALRVSPLVQCLLSRLHGICQETYPPPYNTLICLRDNEVEQLLALQGKRSFVPSKMVDKIHNALSALRYGVYQLLGFLSHFLSASDVLGICASLTSCLVPGSLNFMKYLLKLALIPFVEANNELVEPTLSFIIQFFQSNPSVLIQQEDLTPEQKELIKEKLLRSIAKGIESQVIEKGFLENGRWKSISSSTLSIICDVLLCIGKVIDTNYCFNLLKRFFEISSPDVDPAAIHTVHCTAFQRIAQLIFSCDDNTVGTKGVSFFCNTAGEFVVSHFDSASSILSHLGVEKEVLTSLYGRLLLSRNNHVKVSVCRDFFLEEKSKRQNAVFEQ